ncbi:MAG TPA: undecaprenyl-diphosphatase UppP [Bryobacteraceae bacterium]|nr:undecaprenyl-diphosphatase UppP [Bryobacteraceae bacterium]
MPLYQVVVLAIVQGLAEFLPISSSAHLTIVPRLLHWEDPGLTFDVALHVGTLVAVLIYFYRDWIEIIAHGFGMRMGRDRELQQNPKLLWFLVLGTIPGAIAGLLFEKQAEHAFRSSYVIGGMLIGVGILMWVADRMTSGRETLANLTPGDALTVGVAQAFAIIPGVSRSGITIVAGLFRNFERAAAARFSFLLSTPIIAGAAAKKFWDVHKAGGIPHEMRVPFAVGVLVSGVVGAMVIALFIKYLRSNSLRPFVWYRIIFGIIVIALAIFRYTAE